MLLGGVQLWLDPITDVDLVLAVASHPAYTEAAEQVDVVLLDLNLRDQSDPAQRPAARPTPSSTSPTGSARTAWTR